jgi:glycosyltransferase involved in cell wall biosynthesis
MTDRPLRILHLTAGSDAGGLSRYIYDLCVAMQARGHDVTVAGERGAWHSLFENAPFPWIELPLKRGPLALWRSANVLERYCREHKIDLIHCHYRRTTLVSKILKRRLGIPVLFTLHVTGISLSGINRFLSNFGDLTHAASSEARRWLIETAHVPPDHVVVIPHGIDPAKFPFSSPQDQLVARRELRLPADVLIAGFVGRFDYPKNEEWMLDLAAAARESLPGLHIVMIGEGPHEGLLRRRIARENLGSTVTILPYGDPHAVYRASDAILLTSRAEGFSFVNTEAMSTGRPVLRTRTAGTAEQIIEGVTGRSVAIDRDAFVRGALEFLGQGRERLRAMGLAGAEHARQHLTFDRQLAETLSLYRAMIAGMSNRGHA